MKTFRHLFVIFFPMLFLISQLGAELPPDVYLEMQQAAKEVVTIKVDAVESKKQGFFDFSGKRNERVEATVTAVTKSASGLKPGAKISIVYVHRPLKKGMAGASPIPRLEAGREYPAWLSAAPKEQYEPAARGFSFSHVHR